MRTLPAMTVAATLAFASTALADGKPTVVLVHGAFAGSSSWNGVVTELEKNDYRTVAAVNPLRSVAGDAAVVASRLDRRAGRPGGPFLWRTGHYGSGEQGEERQGAGLCGCLLAGCRRVQPVAFLHVARQHPGGGADAGYSAGRRHRSLHSTGEFPYAVRGRRSCIGGRADGGHAAPRNTGGTGGAFRQGLVADDSFLRNLRVRGPDHPAGHHEAHGGARPFREDHRDRRCLACADGFPSGRGRRALAFISTEIHRQFKPMWHKGSEGEKVRAARTITGLFEILADRQVGDFLFGEQPSVADFYLFVMLLWAERFGIDVPLRLADLRARLLDRAAVRTAMRHENLI